MAVEAIALLLPLLAAIYFGGPDSWYIGLSALITGIIGFALLVIIPHSRSIGHWESYVVVSVGWLVVAAFGALPFYLSGFIPSYIDAFFETMSGFTTTGASILSNIEGLPHGLLLWRSLTHWLGGMGILVLALAFLQSHQPGRMKMFKAESPGPSPEKIAPKMKETARLLYGIYLLISGLTFIMLLWAGMNWFDALNHAFSTIGTGGFSTKNTSIAYFDNPAVHYVLAFFMLVAGGNFALYYFLLRGRLRPLLADEEMRFYALMVVVTTAVITVSIQGSYYQSLEESFRQAVFQVSTIISSTGYATADYDQWPEVTKALLFGLTMVGGCTGSTAGGMKQLRLLLMLKLAWREILRMTRPKAVFTVKLNGKQVPEAILNNVSSFMFLYLAIAVFVSLILLARGLDAISAITAVVACLSNVGPGLGLVGPVMNYGPLDGLSKMILSLCMVMGRLEIYTVLVLFIPRLYQR